MSRIPFGKTISFAYGFVAGDFLTLLGIVWLPSVLLVAATYFAMGPYMAHLPTMFGDNPDPDLLFRNMRFVWLVDVAGWIVSAMLIAGVTAQALGLRPARTLVYFSLGPAVWRVFAAYFLAIVAVVVMSILLAIAVAIVAAIGGAIFAAAGAGSSLGMAGIGGGLLGLAILLVACFAIYVDVRLFSFIAPVVVAEKKIDLIRAWTLTHGNFWRLFGIWLAIGIPFVIASWVIYAFLLGWQLLPPISLGHLMAMHDPQVADAYIQQQVRGWVVSRSQHWQESLLYAAPVAIVVAAIWHGLSNGAMAFAYRALVPPSGAAQD